jgi:hypothetical protein
MSSSGAGQYFQNSQYYQQFQNFPQYARNYIPMVNVPTLNKMPTHGEIVASIELLTATMKQFSTRLDRIESRVNDWVNLGVAERMNINEKNIESLQKHVIENDEKIISTSKDINYAYESIRDTNGRIRENEKIIDRLTDIVSHHKSNIHHLKKNSSNVSKKYAEIGILRRRISKVEDFNTEFVQCFDTPAYLRGIIMDMSSQMEECDKAVTMMVKYGCGKCGSCGDKYSNFCDYYKEMETESCNERSGLEDWKTVEEYFKNYNDNDDEVGQNENEIATGGDKLEEIEKVDGGNQNEEDNKGEGEGEAEEVEDDDFEKL